MSIVKDRTGPLVGAVLIAVVLGILSASLIGGKIFSSGDNLFQWAPFSASPPVGWRQPSNFLLTDPVQGFIPNMLQARSDLSHGVLPLWTPYVGGGRPLFASQVDALLFPLTWLAFLLPFWTSLAWIAAGKLLLAALGTYFFVRDLGLRRGPSLLSALAYACGMFFVVWLEHPQTNVWLCLPWMLLGARRICLRGSLGATALLGAATGLAWQGGHPESAAFLMAATAAYAAFELIADRRSSPESAASTGGRWGPGWAQSFGARTALVVVGLLLGVGVGAVTVAPLLELLGQAGPTNRGGPPLPMNAIYSFAFPELWGMPNKLFSGAGPVNFNERTAYIGALPALLAIGALGRRRPREVWFFVGLAIASFVLTFNVPLLATGIRKLPDANVARLTRFLIILSFAGAVLAGYGLQRWLTASSRERGRMLLVMGGAAVIPPLYWLVQNPSVLGHLGAALGQLPTVHFAETNAAVVELASIWRWTLICALGLGGLALIWRMRWPMAWTIALVVALTAVDLVTLDRGYHGSIPLAQANPPVPSSIRYLQEHQGDQRIVATDYAMPANVGARYGLRDARVGIDIPYPVRFTNLWTGLGGVSGDLSFIFGASPDAHRLADIFAVRYALVPPGAVQPKWLKPVLHTSGGTVELNPTALPRAWVAYGWRPARGSTDALAATLASTTDSLRDDPVIEGARTPPTGPTPTGSVASVVDNSANRVTVRALAERPGYLVLDDSAYPGWQVTVDGRATSWHPANENFRAVPIPAGAHTVVFRYRPASVIDGAIVSVLSILALIALAVAGIALPRAPKGARALNQEVTLPPSDPARRVGDPARGGA